MTSKIESNGDISSWTKFLTAQISHRFSCRMNFLADEQNKVLLCCDNTVFPQTSLQFVTEDECIQVDHRVCYCEFLLNYVPTLVQVSQGQYPRTKQTSSINS